MNKIIKLGDREIAITLDTWAEQADGSCVIQSGETVTLVTAVMSKQEIANQGFFPLTVDYEERFYAAGKILGSRYMRREGRPSDEAIITARLIDRAIRPLFPKGFKKEVQVIATCLSWDGSHDPDTAGLLGASIALSLSGIPWGGPLGVVRIGRLNGKLILNPTYQERAESDLDFVLAAVKKGNDLLFNMIEAESDETPDNVYEEALAFAKPFLLQLIEFQEQLIKERKPQKVEFQNGLKETKEQLQSEIREWLGDKLQNALFQGDKHARMEAVDALRKELETHLQERHPDGLQLNLVKDIFEDETDRAVHQGALAREERVDGRKLNEIRPLACEAGLLPRTHGSGLFSRGQTKTLSMLTLGAPGDQRLLEGMEFIGKKRFMHHYNFPPYAPGEVKPLRGPGRREIGHGMLAEKALFPVVPDPDQFPYTIRIVTEVVSSNGSTSMASVCSSTIALMDAGVPIKRPVAGISMGLMMSEDGTAYKLLTDIQGPEDHHGDMDFKIAGTKEGITAIQLDVKLLGITEQIFKETLTEAKRVRHHIIDEVITKKIAEPRPQLSQWAPKIFTIQINPEKIGLVIGSGGKTINKITEEYDVEIDIEESGQIFVTAQDKDNGQKAIEWIHNLTREFQVGEIVKGTVKRILEFGAFVDIGGQEGLIHISQLAAKRVNKVQDVVNIGDVVPVKIIEIDELGRINLSLKEALKETPSDS
ncbi:MAG: polyribonucleotide nucleotidyltransferase [Candidatus Wildermuthbacteria bacterium RIFCSPHIGHO2_02_FULL_45_25]|uniref:Polyribonucleotide nucleotidyltransferase n=1 Tax=Candidatus Wildermuthbacteria bacterium RIFCSPHIGHO2_02_FULL_45_25 TaxID=1802450 RepID=A0A1G2QZW9_9BACT|nr:MAG: polyribonucleotide nucleotidyltransferase [Candidatus Wildermuthbacteria bacterium RIFCSPHIGHO2_02_FULL_45_25]